MSGADIHGYHPQIISLEMNITIYKKISSVHRNKVFNNLSKNLKLKRSSSNFKNGFKIQQRFLVQQVY